MEYKFPEGVEFIQFNNRHIHYNNNPQSWIDDHAEEDLFPVGVYEHGVIEYSLAGTSMHSNDQFDYCVGGIIAIPRDFFNTKEAARSILREYTDWCNGQVFIQVTGELQPNGTWEWEYLGGCTSKEFE